MSKQNIFNTVKLTKPGSNVFDLSHDVKLSCNMGQLVPTLAQECVPGDRFKISCESLLRFAPLVSPVMHRCDVTMHYFFVPNRIIWENWEDYITNTKTGGALPAFPTIVVGNGTGTAHTKLLDYMGIPAPPVGSTRAHAISALPFAAYQKIYNEYYRDQNLQDPEVDSCEDGTQPALAVAQLTTLRNRAWEHDYFTSALPFAQKGDPVQLPLGNFTDVAVAASIPGYPGPTPLEITTAVPGGNVDVKNDISSTFGDNELYAQTSQLNAQAAQINDLRTAFRLQEWLEKAARAGSRYIESILSHFGVRSSDKRLQRPEYITGTKSPVIISEVLNTTGTDDAPQGSMAGHGVSVTSGGYGSYYCEEHGYIIGIMSILPKTAYQQGIPKHFLKTTDPFEFYWPEFAHLGEQEITTPELYAYDNTVPELFGYTPRYAEYRFNNNRVAGDFRTSLDFWHMGRIFAAPPVLDSAFIESDPTHRIFAVIDPDQDKLWCHVLHKISAVRAMPKFGTPTF